MSGGANLSPPVRARLAGALYLSTGVAAVAGMAVRGNLIVGGEPAATAANILSNVMLWRLGGIADLLAAAGDATLALLFFVLFAGVSRPLALLAAFFRLIHAALLAGITLLHYAPLSYLSTARPLKGMTAEQLQAAASVSLRVHATGYNVALFFFGFTCIALGCLIWRSTFLPRFIGAWMSIAGAAYVANSCVQLLSPAHGAFFFRYVLLPCGLGELALILWLLFFGLNEER